MITVVDYGMGNLGSVRNMLQKIGVPAICTADPAVIGRAEKLLLPGVGAFDAAMQRIDAGGFREVLDRKVLTEGVPVLGICLGMQLLTRSSEEGTLPGLGWLPGETKRFPAGKELKVPHMGWNRIYPQRPHPLLDSLPPEPRFYFVHSYYVVPDDPDHVLATTPYGLDFASVIGRGHILGAQFHPERSHKFGARLLANFAGL